MPPMKMFFTEEDLAERRFIVLILNEHGCDKFKSNNPGQREVFYITSKFFGFIRCLMVVPSRILGKFIFEMEANINPYDDFLKGVISCDCHGIIHEDGEIMDGRIASYDRLTEKEKEDTKNRLNALLEKQPKHVETIKRILQDLQNQCDGVTAVLPKKKSRGRQKRC